MVAVLCETPAVFDNLLSIILQILCHKLLTAVDLLVLPLFLPSPDPVVQIAIDNSRNILYTRSEKGVLQVCDDFL